jgi:hypothetical protein
VDCYHNSGILLLSRLKTQGIGAAAVRISYLIIDDFYDDPHVVRDAALHTDYARFEDQQNYPGDNSAEAFEMEGLDEFVSGLVHEPVMGTPGTAHCRFRIATAGSESRARLRMHVDGENYWSGIVYLSLPEHCRGGTEFYRHKELGSDRAPIYDNEVVQYGAESCARFTRDLIRRDSNDASKWEYLMTVPMRFNRCVLFRPWFWHTSGESFGDRGENARMIQVFFFTLDKSRLHGSETAE